MNSSDDDSEEGEEATHTPEPTVLPASVANIVSLVTRSSSLYLRLGTFVGGLAISGARITTLTSLELSRALIEGILHRAGRDVSDRSIGEVGRAEADGMLERSIATLHSTITSISFAASTGFYLSSTFLSSAGDLSQHLLVALDSILGSTDSSRAIASIVTLIRREFQNPATGQEGEQVGVGDLLVGICGLALLQRWCRKITDVESREGKYEDVIWDVVILDDGRRADVVADSASPHRKSIARANSMSFMTPGGHEVVQTIEREGRLVEESDDDLPEINLKRKIMKSLPSDSSVSITTETTTTKIMTVDITGRQPSDLMSPPPGVEIVEKNELRDASEHRVEAAASNTSDGLLAPKYRIVYRFTHHATRATNIASRDSMDDTEEAIEVSDYEGQALEVPTGRFNGLPDLPIIQDTSTEKDQFPETSIKRRSFSGNSVRSLDLSPPPETGNSKSRNLSNIPVPKGIDNVANQKRSRKPLSSSSSLSGAEHPLPKKATLNKTSPAGKAKPERPVPKVSEKKGSFRNALRKGSSTALSHMWNKENSPDASIAKQPSKPAWGVPTAKSNIPVPQRNSNLIPVREAPRPPQRGNPNYFSSRDLGLTEPADISRSQSRTSYYSVHEQRRNSIVSQTDTYSMHSAETRPGSPTTFRTHLKAQSNILRARSEKGMGNNQPGSPVNHHRRSQSHVPSIYTLRTNNSAQTLVLAKPMRSAFEDSETIERLMHTGSVEGLFPQHHIVRNISRFVRFASASYGSHFLRVMGIASPKSPAAKEIDTKHHHEHHSFSTHTQLPPDTILLSSFVDPQGGTDSTGQTNTGVPMVHFVSLDHDSKAVILTCRGTLGFEDVLTDMTCDYDELTYRGKAYKVHKGIHASARRLLDGGGGRVMSTIAAALEEFPDYGLVLCGHSLGGGVVALLATLISEPSLDPSSTAFFTSSDQRSPQLLLTSSTQDKSTAPSRIHLPPGRPIHVYAYGPPATVSPSLRLATRGLITTIVNGQDLVPFLSLGVLHDLQAVALAFKTDDSGAKGEFRKRVIAGITGTFKDKWYANAGPGLGGADAAEDDQWAYSALKVLRASMLSPKLLPPGEVFIVETMPVLQRDAFVRHDGVEGEGGGRGLGRPATRSVLKYVRDVEKRFGELRFGGSMLLDHSPGRYEGSLKALAKGILG